MRCLPIIPLVLILLLSPAAAGTVETKSFACPPKFNDIQEETGTPRSYPFKSVDFYDGDEATGVEIKPVVEEDKDKFVRIWAIPPRRTKPVTAVCRYSGSLATARATLPDRLNRCRLTTFRDEKTPPQMFCE